MPGNGIATVVDERTRISTEELFPEKNEILEATTLSEPAPVDPASGAAPGTTAPILDGSAVPGAPAAPALEGSVTFRTTDMLAQRAERSIYEQERYAYLIGPGDTLFFQTLNDPGLNQEVQVRYDGFISLPHVPDIDVKNTTREEATARVRAAYEEVFIEPEVSLSIVASNSKTYTVMGDVSSPNQYAYTHPITLLDAINLAGGLRINQRGGDTFVGGQGQLTKALIIRTIDGQRRVTEYDLRGLSNPGPHASTTPVYPNDIVYVPEGVNLVYVLGEVREQGIFQLTEGMTLLELLVRAQGVFFQTARMRHVVLMREVDDQTTEVMTINLRRALKTGISPELHPGDIVYVPRAKAIELYEFLQRFVQYTNLVSPIFSLYQQAWATYYTDEQFERLYETDADGFNDTLFLQQSVQDLLRALPNLSTTIPGL